jgi:anti-sigma B factor antagonist
MNSGMVNPGMGLSVQRAGGITIAELTGELDVATAQGLREELLSLLRPGSSQLVIDLSGVSFCDASGLAVLINIAHRAELLGGFLRLAAVSPQVARVLNITGLDRHLASFPTASAAATGVQAAQHRETGSAAGGPAVRAHPGPANRRPGLPPVQADAPARPVAATAARLRRVLSPAPRLAAT